MPRFILICAKTGRNLPTGSTGQAYSAAWGEKYGPDVDYFHATQDKLGVT